MTWFKLDDTWLTHPKVQAAGLRGRALWIAGGLHCAQHLTDGRIDHHLVPILAALAGVSNGTKEARHLVSVGLWIDGGDHYTVTDYLDYQPSRERVISDRAKAAERQKRARSGTRESRRDITRDSRSSHAVSHTYPDPTRPDPSSDTYVLPPPPITVVGDDSAAADRAIAAIADYELELAVGRGVPIDDTGAYRGGIAKRLTANPDLAALIARHPDETAEQLRDRWLAPEALTTLDDLAPGVGGAS